MAPDRIRSIVRLRNYRTLPGQGWDQSLLAHRIQLNEVQHQFSVKFIDEIFGNGDIIALVTRAWNTQTHRAKTVVHFPAASRFQTRMRWRRLCIVSVALVLWHRFRNGGVYFNCDTIGSMPGYGLRHDDRNSVGIYTIKD